MLDTYYLPNVKTAAVDQIKYSVTSVFQKFLDLA